MAKKVVHHSKGPSRALVHAREMLARARKTAHRFPRTKSIGMAIGVGAAADLGIDKLSDNFAFVRDNWYGPPLVMTGVSAMLFKRAPVLAIAMAGAAGAIGRQQFAKHQAATAGTSPPASTTTQGMQEPMGMLPERNTGGMNYYPPDTGSVQSPDASLRVRGY